MESILRSSEFWVSLVVIVGISGTQAGLWSDADFQSLIKPALTYVVARLISKFAKTVQFGTPTPPAPPAK